MKFIPSRSKFGMAVIKIGKIYPKSRIEISGFTARNYETLLNVITFGYYRRLVIKMVRGMDIDPSDKIIDFGAGSGYNEYFMKDYLSAEGEILALDIGEEMIKQFRNKFDGRENIKIKNQRIDQILPYEEEFDKVLISFVLHGLPQESREKTIENALKVLKTGGEFFVFDYGETPFEDMPFYFRIPFSAIECEYAYDFLERDWNEILLQNGFSRTKSRSYSGGLFRLLKAVK